MAEYITLLGSEQVQSAGRNISQAAGTISSAANTIEAAVYRLQIIAQDGLLERLVVAMEKLAEQGERR